MFNVLATVGMCGKKKEEEGGRKIQDEKRQLKGEWLVGEASEEKAHD